MRWLFDLDQPTWPNGQMRPRRRAVEDLAQREGRLVQSEVGQCVERRDVGGSRGQPRWVKTLMAKGASLEDLRVDSAALVQNWLKRAGR